MDRARDFPDGFLHFSHTLEFYPRPQTQREDRISLTARVLTFLWGRGLPAVAACDYEDALPKGGGYKDRSIPWPSKTLESPDLRPPGSAAPRVGEPPSPTKHTVMD